MRFLSEVVFDVAVTSSLYATLVLFGLPIYAVMHRWRPMCRVSIGACSVIGLAWFTSVSWYAFALQLKLTFAYRAIIALTILILALCSVYVALKRRASIYRLNSGLRAVAPDVLTFVICVTVYTYLFASRVAPDKLPWVVSGNNDILAYLKVGNYLRFFPNAAEFVDTKNLKMFAANDVFGVVNLVSFASFLFRTGVESLAIPTMGLGVGMIGVAVARSCRRIFNLGFSLATLIALMAGTSPMMSYIMLNYFLSQVIFAGIFLTVLLLLLEASSQQSYSRLGSFMFVSAAAIAVMFCYPAWLLQYIAMLTALFALTSAWRPGRQLSEVAVRTAIGGLLYPILCYCVLCIISFFRATLAIHKLIEDSIPRIAGWPLSFVDLQLLIGLPANWRMMDKDVSVYGESVGVILAMALLLGLLLRFDKLAGAFERRMQLVAFAATVGAYLFVWYWFGYSYHQWKFATTVPLGLGFTVVAAAIYVLSLNASPRGRLAIRSSAAFAVTVCLGMNIGQFYDRWSRTLTDFPISLSNAKSIDAMSGTDRAYVDISDYGLRMAAAVFINFKPTSFSGPTYYGDGSAPPATSLGPFAEMRRACATLSSGTRYAVRTVEAAGSPKVPLGENLAFSAQSEGCFDLQGFSVPEPWGRWTDGKHASIKFRCGCDLSERGAKVILKAGALLAPGLRDRQAVHFTVNGGKTQDIVFDMTAYRDLTVDVPRRDGPDDSVDIEIDLPDAISPGADTRILGMSVVSLTIQAAAARTAP